MSITTHMSQIGVHYVAVVVQNNKKQTDRQACAHTHIHNSFYLQETVW